MKTATIKTLLISGVLAACHSTAFCDEEEKPIAAEAPQLGRPVEFERDVYPILEANCIACHNAATAENQLILENAAAILKGGSAGPSIVPGKPEESLFINVAARTAEPVMPPWPNDVQAKKLTPKELGILQQWVAEGAVGGSAAKTLVMNWQPINDQLKAVYSVDVDPYGRFVAAGRGGKVTVYDLATNGSAAKFDDPAIHPADSTAVAHRDYVHAIAIHPSGDLIATSGFQEVKLWQRQTTGLASVMTFPAGTTQWSTVGDGQQLAVAGAGPGISVVNTATGESVAQIDTDGQPVTALVGLAGTVPRIAAALGDGRIQISTITGEGITRSEALPLSSTSLIGFAAGAKLAALGQDGSVRVLAVAADTGLASGPVQLPAEAGPASRLDSDGAVLATLSGQKLELWKAEDNSRMAALDMPAAVADFSLNTVTDRLAVQLADGQLLLWSVKEPKQLAVLNQDLPAIRTLKHLETVKAICDARAAVLKAQVDESEKEVVAQKEAETKAKAELEKMVAATAEAQKKLDEAIAAATAAKSALEGKADDAALKQASEAADKAQTAAQEAINAANSNQQLAQKSVEFATAAVTRAEGRVAERKQQQEAAQQEATAAAAAAEAAKPAAATTIGVASCRLTAGGTLVAATDTVGNVRVWKAADGVPVDLLPAAADFPAITATRISGDLLLMTDAQGRLATRSTTPGWVLKTVLGPAADPATPSVFTDRVLSLAFSPDGHLLAAGGGEASRSGQVTIWDIRENKLVHELKDAHSDTVYGLEFSPDGKLLATASADKFAKVFDVGTGKHIQSYEGHTHHVMDVSWKADRTVLASAGADNAIKVWNAETGEQARTISNYSKQVTSLQFVGLQDQMLSSSGDRRVFLHTASNGAAVREFGGSPDYVYRAAVTPDGTIVAAGCEDGVLRVWNGADGKEIAKFPAD